MSQPRARVVIIGGGPGGYEAALVAAQLGAEVTLADRDGLGGACVLTDCVPSKTLIATSGMMAALDRSAALGIRLGSGTADGGTADGGTADGGTADGGTADGGTADGGTADGGAAHPAVDAPRLYARVLALARAQSADVAARLAAEGVEVVSGAARLSGPKTVVVGDRAISADVVLLASGAEFASAYQALGSQVTLISSRDHVLPHEDTDAAVVIEDVFRRRGMTVLSRSRAVEARRTASGTEVILQDGRTIRGSHCLLTVGMVPSTRDLGLERAGITLDSRGFVPVDRVSRTSAPGVYAAGDCTGVMMLASVAAMQGRIAMWHALGEAVQPIRLSHVAATIFTEPEIATVGVTHRAVEAGEADALVVKLPLATNARAKMQGFADGFIKLFARRGSGIVLGGVVVAPRASELILAVSLAVEQLLTVDQMAHTFAVYPSLSGSLTEAARRLMQPAKDTS